MIANISPSVTTFDDTYNTLKYANRAKNIKTQVQRNVVNVQYHISNYNQIISNLKNEITELKTQLSKKDNILINIIPSKSQEKNENNLINSVNNNYFEKCVLELKAHCEDEIFLKKKIIDQEKETNNKNYLLYKKIYEESNNNSSLNMLNIFKDNSEFNNDINLEEKDNLLNQNNSLISNIGKINNSDDNNFISNAKELEGKQILLKKTLEKNVENFKELLKKRDQLLNTYFKNGIKDFHYEYLKSLIKAHDLKIFIVENRFKEKFNYVIGEVKENYITILEDQLNIRDNLIKKQNVEKSSEDAEKLKSLEQLKNEFSNRLPIILNKKLAKDTNITLDLNYSNLSTNYLPPINKHNIYSVLGDLKNVNINSSRVDLGKRINQINKIKSDYNSNLGKLEKENKNKFTRNYSQGVRILNKGINNLAKNQNDYSNNIGNNGSNPVSFNRGNLQNKHISSKNIKKSKNFYLNLINKRKKDSNSENDSNDYDSFINDLDNSGEETQIKRTKNKVDRKSVESTSFKNNDDSTKFSPKRKDNNIKIYNKKEDFLGKNEILPQLKKKDLNVFLSDKYKNKIQLPKKIQFK